MKMGLKKKLLIAFAGTLLLVAGYLKYPVDALWPRDVKEGETETDRIRSESEKRENREVRFVGCNGIF